MDTCSALYPTPSPPVGSGTGPNFFNETTSLIINLNVK